jgi:hypothetical protein
VKVLFVTHQFDLAHGFYAADLPTVLFLRAEREAEGQRTFKIIEGEPLPTSYGEDSYRKIFGPIGQSRRSHAPTNEIGAVGIDSGDPSHDVENPQVL